MTDASLGAVLSEARRLGFLGPGPLEPAIEHAGWFTAALPAGPALVLDLGAGGGLPGLVIAVERPDLTIVLLDASERRTSWLRRAVARLELAERVEVVTARAQAFGRDPQRRAAFDAVVARGFGPPMATAECAAPLLQVGGTLVVSEPPEPRVDQWDPTQLEELGLDPVDTPAGLMVLRQVRLCPGRYPRHRAR